VGGVRSAAACAPEGGLEASKVTRASTRMGFCERDRGKARFGSGGASRGGAEAKGFNIESFCVVNTVSTKFITAHHVKLSSAASSGAPSVATIFGLKVLGTSL
jgi:hypothetical protein